MLAAVARVGRHERREHPRRAAATPPRVREVLALFAMAAAAAALLYGARDMPRVGDAQAPANRNPDVAQYYLEHGPEEGGRAENVVTSVLADYRGYDTLGETTVIFTAALCVVLLLRLSVSRRDIARSEEDDERTSPGEEPS
jgi:multicomponent Na+:H+ antiporter subunit B